VLQARIACAFVCLTGLATASAQELSERQFLEEFPTVLSASRLRQNARETPQAITVIDQAMIKASGAREFAELFRLVPGFTVSYVTYVKGLQPIVTYHGLGREFFSRLQVLIDGRSINNATLGGVDWSAGRATRRRASARFWPRSISSRSTRCRNAGPQCRPAPVKAASAMHPPELAAATAATSTTASSRDIARTPVSSTSPTAASAISSARARIGRPARSTT
jgi:hypothetical protein